MRVQFRAMAHAGCLQGQAQLPQGFSATSGIHTALTSVHFCRHFGGFSNMPVVACNPKGAVESHLITTWQEC